MKKKVKEFYLNDQGELVDAKERSNTEDASIREVSVSENVESPRTDTPSYDMPTQNGPITRETIIRETYVNNNNQDGYVNNVSNIENNYRNERPQEIKQVQTRRKKEDVILKKDFDEDSKLISNPFFYDYSPEIEDNIHTISSIEDFYIGRKKKYYSFSYLVRSNDMSLYKRRKILKYGMKNWRVEIEKRLSDVSTYGSSQFQTTEMKIGRLNHFAFSLIAVVAIMISLILLNGKIWIFHCPSNPWLLGFIYVAIGCSILSISMLHLIDRGVVNIKKLYILNKIEYNYRKNEIEKELKKKYQNTYKYYVKGLKKKFKKPVLLLDKTAIGESKIRKVENVVVSNNRKFLSAEKAAKLLAFPKFILNSLSVLSCAYVFLYAIYQIVVYFIGK